MKRTILLLAVVAVLAGVAIYQYIGKNPAFAASSEVKPKPGYTAPVVELTDLNEKTIGVGGQRDKLLIVNFWASWCYPCELEVPDLKALAQQYAGKLDLYGINATSYDQERQARQFVADQNISFPILMDRDGKAAASYKVDNFPTSLIIDSRGIVRERINGVISKDEWVEKIDKWLKFDAEKSQPEAS